MKETTIKISTRKDRKSKTHFVNIEGDMSIRNSGLIHKKIR